jgi:uncharacterized damage-inducible protein DinB
MLHSRTLPERSLSVPAAVQTRFDRLESSRRALLDSLANLDDAALRRPPAAGGWSIVQVVGHLTMADEATLGYLRKKMQAPAAIPPAGPMSWVRMIAVAAVLRSPVRRRAPPQTASPPADVGLGEAAARWHRVRAEWAAFLDAFPAELARRAVFRHPFAGRMSIAHTLGFMQEHQRHHARQIGRLRAAMAPAVALGQVRKETTNDAEST